MNTCDHYNYVKTKAYAESLKETCLQTCVCDSYNLSLDQALKKCIRCLQQLKKDSPLKSKVITLSKEFFVLRNFETKPQKALKY